MIKNKIFYLKSLKNEMKKGSKLGSSLVILSDAKAPGGRPCRPNIKEFGNGMAGPLINLEMPKQTRINPAGQIPASGSDVVPFREIGIYQRKGSPLGGPQIGNLCRATDRGSAPQIELILTSYPTNFSITLPDGKVLPLYNILESKDPCGDPHSGSHWYTSYERYLLNMNIIETYWQQGEWNHFKCTKRGTVLNYLKLLNIEFAKLPEPAPSVDGHDGNAIREAQNKWQQRERERITTGISSYCDPESRAQLLSLQR
jgi:hypothetical protein